MTIYIVDAEDLERQFFSTALEDRDLRFARDLNAVSEDAQIVSVFIESTVTRPFLQAHPQLRFVTTRSSSLDHIDIDACRDHGVTVAYVPNYGNATVAEHTFALILALTRRLREVMAAPQQGRFSYTSTRGVDLSGKVLGVIGMGRIGQRVTRLAHAFGMRVVAYDPFGCPPERAEELGFHWLPFESLLAQSHIISLHLRLTPETYHIIRRETLALCRPGVLIINTARGGLIDTPALREALESGHVGGAGLDVLEDERILREPLTNIISAEIVERLHADVVPDDILGKKRLHALQGLVQSDSLLSRSNVVFTPHVAFNSVEAVERLNRVTVENIRSFLSGSPMNVA